MPSYTPFLKFKQNEILALSTLDEAEKASIIPLFDIPRPKEQTDSNIIERLEIGLKKIEQQVPDIAFYIDNFDLDDSVFLNGVPQYRYILDTLNDLDVVPVVALNRHTDHNDAALSFVTNQGSSVAVRLTQEDIESYRITKADLLPLWGRITDAGPNEPHLVLDFRVISMDVVLLRDMAVNFLASFAEDFTVDRIVVAGSSIPPMITTLLATNTDASVERQELHVWREINKLLPKDLASIVRFGDYGLVSPEYSDIDLDPKIMQSVATPKVFYTYSTKHFVIRGSAFKTHPKGYAQYYDIADTIVGKPYFRGAGYSYGEQYIHERSLLASPRARKGGSPGSWLKATLVSHITFVLETL
jgi:hypothetical protein